MIGLALSLAVALPTGPAEVTTLREATIAGYGRMPPWGSGILHMVREVRVTTADGKPVTLYVTYLGPDDHFPAAGSRCNIAYSEAKKGTVSVWWNAGPEGPTLLIQDYGC